MPCKEIFVVIELQRSIWKILQLPGTARHHSRLTFCCSMRSLVSRSLRMMSLSFCWARSFLAVLSKASCFLLSSSPSLANCTALLGLGVRL